MGIKKTDNGWIVDYRDITKTRHRHVYKNKADAITAYSNAMSQKSKGVNSYVDKKITVTDACLYFLNEYVKIECKEKTIDEYSRIINKDIIPYFKDTSLAVLSKKDVIDFRKHLYEKKNISVTTLNKYITLLGAIIQKQVDNEKIFRNVAREVKKMKDKTLQQPKSRALSIEEINILLKTCKKIKPEFYPILYTAIYTGMRRGELLALQWKNVDFTKNKIFVEFSEYKGKLQTPKTKSSIRYIHMCKELKSFLVEHKLKSKPSEFVFPNSNGGLYDGHNVSNRLFKPVVKASKLKHFRFHDIRHTYCSVLYEKGIQAKYLQSQLGHSSERITNDVYTHIDPNSTDVLEQVMNDMYKIS